MNKHYKQLAEVIIPSHDAEEHGVKLYVFDVDDEKADELSEAYFAPENGFDNAKAADIIREDLGCYDSGIVPPGAMFYRYSISFDYPHTVLVWETCAYNV